MFPLGGKCFTTGEIFVASLLPFTFSSLLGRKRSAVEDNIRFDFIMAQEPYAVHGIVDILVGGFACCQFGGA